MPTTEWMQIKMNGENVCHATLQPRNFKTFQEVIHMLNQVKSTWEMISGVKLPIWIYENKKPNSPYNMWQDCFIGNTYKVIFRGNFFTKIDGVR